MNILIKEKSNLMIYSKKFIENVLHEINKLELSGLNHEKTK